MKLYATTTSERASKGQGGNDFLKISLQRDREKLSHIIEYTSDVLCVYAIRNTETGQMIGKDLVYREEKGERQKGEHANA